MALAGGVALHAVNVYVATTIMPSVVAEIGGLAYYAWSTTVFVIASIIGSTLTAQVLERLAPRGAYRLAVALFAAGTLVCGAAPSMPLLLVGRTIQGLGGGLLFALSYAMIRRVFPEPLWPRALALIAGMWGVASLLGPFIGGLCAELHQWRLAFLVLLPVTAVFGLLADRVLTHTHPEAVQSVARIPVSRLALLTTAVLCVSAGSVAGSTAGQLAGIGLAAGLTVALVRVESRAKVRLLPHDAFALNQPLGAIYATMALLIVGTTTEIFVPYMLQTLHGLPPLAAGYVTVIEAVTWTFASIAVSGLAERGARLVLVACPAVMALGLAGLAWHMPRSEPQALAWVCVWLALIGVGIGMGWPHLLNRVLVVAPDDEQDLAASSITTIQLFAAAFGTAIGGMVANFAGLTVPGGPVGVGHAANWLFGLFALGPTLAVLTTLVLIRSSGHRPQAA